MVVFRLLSFGLFWLCVLPWLRLLVWRRGTRGPWVIGGHGGRIYADNAAALHRFIAQHTQQPIVWITSAEAVARTLRAEGHAVLRRDTLRARCAIWQAPVLIRSHGNGDLDEFLVRWCKPPGTLFYLGHCLSFIKALGMANPQVARMSERARARYQRRLTAFDYALACSQAERDNFALCFPHRKERIELGGGAHLDEFLLRAKDNAPDRSVLYFPTFRDADIESEQSLDDVIEALTRHPELLRWLGRTGRKLIVAAHVNHRSRVASPDPARVEITTPERIVELLLRCEVLISDYSGTLCNALLIDRPVVRFPYDLAAYLRVRRLYVDYDELDFGPIAHDVEALVRVLTEERWRDPTPYAAKRRQWVDRMFVSREPGYARRSYEAIVRLAGGRPG